MISERNRYLGTMLGLASGDALGAPHEGGPLEQLVWRMIGRTTDGCMRWTDDTQMALDLAESLLEHGRLHPEALATRFADSYRWSRGYGPGAAKVLKRIRRGEHWQAASRAVYTEGSFGNGAAMRAPVLALFHAGDREGMLEAARVSAQITHAHPLGIEGAVLMVQAASMLMHGRPAGELLDSVRTECTTQEISQRLSTISAWIEGGNLPAPREVAGVLGNGIAAHTSCPTALYIALRHLDQSFETMMQFIIACRGDVDTIGSMAGALWGMANGEERLPPVRLEARERIVDVATRLHAKFKPR